MDERAERPRRRERADHPPERRGRQGEESRRGSDTPRRRPGDPSQAPRRRPAREIEARGREWDPAEGQRRSRTPLYVGIGAAVAVLALIVVVITASQSSDDDPPAATPIDPNTATTLAASEFTEVHDEETGFTMRYPRSWQRYQVPVGEIRLLVGVPGQQDSVSVKYFPTTVPTTAENLVNIKTLLDNEVFAQSQVQLAGEGQTTVNGMLAYRYVYTFNDDVTGQQGAHSHYFVFQGRKVFSLVFQAVPATNFNHLEPVYNQMLASFRVEPEAAGPLPTVPGPTSGPAATTSPTTAAPPAPTAAPTPTTGR